MIRFVVSDNYSVHREVSHCTLRMKLQVVFQSDKVIILKTGYSHQGNHDVCIPESPRTTKWQY